MAKKHDAGIKVGIEGNAEFKRAIKEINDELKTLDSELKLVESQYAGQLNSLEALTAKGEVLEKQYEAQSKALELLEKQLQATEEAKKKLAAEGEELARGIEAQKEVIAEFKEALAGSEDGVLELRDANGNLILTIKDGYAEVARLEAELKDMERALAANARAQQDAAKLSNNYTRQINETKVKLNDLSAEIQQNELYMAEAAASTDKCAKSIDKYGKEVKDAGENSGLLQKIFAGGFMSNIASQALQTVTGKIKELVKGAMDAADQLMRMSATTRLTTDQLQEWEYIGAATGVSIDIISSALARLVNNMDAARAGSREQKEAFADLGIELTDNTGRLRNSVEVFYEVVDALSRMTSETERDAIAQDLIGRSATELNPIIREGSAALREMAEEAHRFGAVMSEETVKKLDEAGDRLDKGWIALKARAGDTIASILDWLNNLIYGHDFAANSIAGNIESLKDDFDGLVSSYETAANAAEKSIKAQMGLWEDMSGNAKKSYTEIKSAVISQIEWLEQYTTNLANLASRNVEGIDMLIDKLADGSRESAAILAGLATASDEELKSLIDRMAEVDTRQIGLSRQIAQIKTDFSRQFNELSMGMQKAAEELNASDVAKKAGQNTIQGYIDGAKSKTKEVVDAYRKLAKDANQAFKDELKIKSPSRVAMETTENYFKGHILKARQMAPEVAQAYAEPAKKAQMAVQSLLMSPIEEPKPDYAAQAAMIGESISKALASAPAGGRVVNLTVNLTPEIDGRVLARMTRQYRIEEDSLHGGSLVNEVT